MRRNPSPYLTTAILTILASTAVPRTASAAASYIGSKRCKACHLGQYNSWSETKMAKAFDLLKPGAAADAKKAAKLDPNKDYTKVAECLACHTTGYGKPGGFVNEVTTPDRAGVGCEMCHGPGGSYVAEDKMSLRNKEYKRADLVSVGLVAPPTAAQCTSVCHNNKSPFFKPFDFAKRKDQGTHEHKPLKYQH